MRDEVQSGYKPAQDEVLRMLGLAIIAGQGVERLMATCITFPLNGKPIQTRDELDALLTRHSKATLGQLLKVLRQKVELHPTFDGYFERFLQSRNVIAHRLHDAPGGLDMHSDEGRSRLKAFLLQYMADGEILSMVFLGLLRDWAQQVDIDLPGKDHFSQRMTTHLDTNVLPHLGDLIRFKAPDAGP